MKFSECKSAVDPSQVSKSVQNAYRTSISNVLQNAPLTQFSEGTLLRDNSGLLAKSWQSVAALLGIAVTSPNTAATCNWIGYILNVTIRTCWYNLDRRCSHLWFAEERLKAFDFKGLAAWLEWQCCLEVLRFYLECLKRRTVISVRSLSPSQAASVTSLVSTWTKEVSKSK